MIFRPPSTCHLPVLHVKQHDTGECLVACATMVCTYVGIPVSYQRLLKVLRIQRGLGTPFYQIRNLTALNINVTYREQGTLQELHELLCHGWPCIVGVRTQELPYWDGVDVQHAVVVTGMDPQAIYLNDPEFPDSPIRVSLGDFDLAWLEQKEVYAVLAPASK